MAFTTQGPDYSITAPDLTGVWIHSVGDPAGTEANYLYHSSERSESLEVNGASISFLGRTFPVVEFATEESEVMALSIKVPMDDQRAAAVEAIRVLVRSRGTVCYRDNRQRLVFGAILGSVTINDTNDGSALTLDITRVDYTVGVPFSQGGNG